MGSQNTSEFILWSPGKIHELEASGSYEGWAVEQEDNMESGWKSLQEDFKWFYSIKLCIRINQILKFSPTQQKAG